MSKFKVGDKVFADKSLAIKGREGLYGINNESVWNRQLTIKSVSSMIGNAVQDYGVEENPYYYPEYSLIPEQPRREFIVIHRSGNVMTAEHRVNREIIKSAKATCAPSDTFDFDTGAKLAFDRLIGREEPKPAPQPARRFKVGDRVVIEGSENIGEISAIKNDGCPYLVFHKDGTHSGGGFGVNVAKPEHLMSCSWFCESDLSPAHAPEPPKYYTGKVVCVHNATVLFRDTFPVGLIVTIKDGKITSHLTGKEMRVDYAKKEMNEIKSVDDLNNRFYKDILFAKVKEPSDV